MNKIKFFIGWLLAGIFPATVKKLKSEFTIPSYLWKKTSKFSLVERFIRIYLGEVMLQSERSKSGTLETVHKQFWASNEQYFSSTKTRFEKAYLPTYSRLIEEIQDHLKERGITRIVEFGCGDGQWLNYLHRCWTDIEEFVGIDLSQNQIQINRGKYNHLTFICEDINSWSEKQVHPKSLYHTMGGVLEYLSEESVKSWLTSLQKTGMGSLILLIEPIHGDYNLDLEKNSRIIGFECSYTHNYKHLMESVGIKIIHSEVANPIGSKWLTVLGSL